MLSDLHNELQSARGRWVKLANKGDSIEGVVVGFEIRGLTWEGKPVISSKTGQQRREWVFTLRTDLRDDDDDDGIRKVPLKEAGQRAVRDAIADAKVTNPKAGDRLKIAVTKDKESYNSQPTFRARWTVGEPIEELVETAAPATTTADWDEEPF